jgi:hypothetical protein
MQATTTSKIVDRASLTPECAKKPPSENAQTIPQVNAHAEHVQLLLSTIERLSEHLDLDGQLAALQQARAALMEEAQVRTQVQQTSKTTNELSNLQQQVYSLTGEPELILSDLNPSHVTLFQCRREQRDEARAVAMEEEDGSAEAQAVVMRGELSPPDG